MSKRILIVDDDADFSALLADVFTQADYTVQVINDPRTIEKALKSGTYDLLITDLRMPGRDGFEVVALLRQTQPGLPAIMVSGFLDPETRERIEAEGIIGVYEKPLSVFTLLKTASKVIAEASREESIPVTPTGNKPVEAPDQSDLGFPFDSLPCISPASAEFARKLNRQALRRPNFSIVGEPGLPLVAIAEDIAGWFRTSGEENACAMISAEEFTEEKARAALDQAARQRATTLHLIILNADQLSPAQQNTLYSASKRESTDWAGSIRLIFFLSRESEKLYADGIIGNSLYLLMGTQEILIPPLRECREDIKAIIQGFFREHQPATILEAKSLEILSAFDWPQNHSQLRKVLRELTAAQPEGPIKPETVSIALAGTSGTGQARKIQNRTLREQLELTRNDYLRATGILSVLIRK